jgi:hypothetical protein
MTGKSKRQEVFRECMDGENAQRAAEEHILEQVGEIRLESSWIRDSHPLQCKGIDDVYPQRMMSRGVVE